MLVKTIIIELLSKNVPRFNNLVTKLSPLILEKFHKIVQIFTFLIFSKIEKNFSSLHNFSKLGWNIFSEQSIIK